jgi:hypothetical protein
LRSARAPSTRTDVATEWVGWSGSTEAARRAIGIDGASRAWRIGGEADKPTCGPAAAVAALRTHTADAAGTRAERTAARRAYVAARATVDAVRCQISTGSIATGFVNATAATAGGRCNAPLATLLLTAAALFLLPFPLSFDKVFSDSGLDCDRSEGCGAQPSEQIAAGGSSNECTNGVHSTCLLTRHGHRQDGLPPVRPPLTAVDCLRFPLANTVCRRIVKDNGADSVRRNGDIARRPGGHPILQPPECGVAGRHILHYAARNSAIGALR